MDEQYADDDPDYEHDTVIVNDLPEPTDPATIPPDEGDADADLKEESK